MFHAAPRSPLRRTDGANDEVVGIIREGGILREAEVPEPLIRAWQAALEDSWFIVDGAEGVGVPRTGTRPGHPGADVLFAFLEVRITKTYKKRRRGEGLLQVIDSPGLDNVRRGRLDVCSGALEVADAFVIRQRL